MRKELRSILGYCAGVVLLWFGCLGVASAYVRGSISPWFIANGTNYGFGWKANVLVDTGSCGPASTVVGVASSCTGSLVSATGELYQPYPSTQIFPATGSFDFTTSPSSFNDITVYFDGSTVVGLNTGTPIGYYTLAAHIAPVLPDPNNTLPDPNILYDGAYMWLSFSYVPQQLSSTLLTTDTTNLLQSANLLLQPLCTEESDSTDSDDERDLFAPTLDETECTPSPTGTSVLAGYAGPSDITLSVVPEPGSIALICGGLLAFGFLRRRQ